MNHNHRAECKGAGCCRSNETERLQEEERSRKRAQKEQAVKERAEQERFANLPRLSVNFISPPPAVKFEFNVEETVDGALKTVAPHYGVDKADAGLLQLEFSETILTREQQLTAAGLCDESLCRVLGVEAALETGKANILRAQSMDIVDAATFDRMEDVRLVCRYAPEKVNNTDDVSCCYTSTLLVLTLLLWGGTEWEHSSVQGCTQELSGDGTTPFGK